ncbi:MAG: peptidoglycan-binding domain-containing protein [Myxococcaceae bacterium]
MRLGNGSPSVDFNGTRYTSIEGSAADNNISIDNVLGKGKFDPVTTPGIALTTQQARELGVKVGDKVTVRDNRTGAAYTATFYDSAGSKRPGNEKYAHFEVSPALADQLGIKYRNSKGKVIDAVTNSSQVDGRFTIEKFSGAQPGSRFDPPAAPTPSAPSAPQGAPTARPPPRQRATPPTNVDQVISNFDNKYHAAPSLADVRAGRAQLGIGDHGPAVAALQRRLGVEADGYFGPITMRALAAAQRSGGVQDGSLGRAGNEAFSLRPPSSNQRARPPSSEGPTASGDVTGPSGPVNANNTMERLAANARAVAMGMGGYRGGGRCATGVSAAIRRTMGISVSGNGNQIDNNLPRDKFREVHMSLQEALRTPGLVLTWEQTSTRLGRRYGHTAVTLGDGHSSASDFVERNTLAAESGRRGLRIFQPIN